MDKTKGELLTSSEFTFLLVGFAIGPDIIKLPNTLVSIAKQDSWISATLGLIYPIYVVFVGSYIAKNHPRENILSLSRKYFGNIFGCILNFIFCIQWLVYMGAMASSSIKTLRLYIVAFLIPFKISFVIISLAAYGAIKGLKVLGKANEIIHYIIIFVILFSSTTLFYAKISNILPVFDSSLKSILKGTVDTTYYYVGFEVIVLFYPFMEDIKAIKKCGIIAVIISAAIWIWSVFISIVHLGIDIIPKTTAAFIFTFESIHFPAINNFRYIFIFAWSLLVFKIIANCYFASIFIIKDITKIDLKKLCIYIYPLTILISLLFMNDSISKIIHNVVTPAFVAFNNVFISVIALISYMKDKVHTGAKYVK